MEQADLNANPQPDEAGLVDLSATTEPKKSSAAQIYGICLLLVLAVFAVFGQARHFDFVGYDDQEYVYQNSMVRRGLSEKAVGWAFTHAQVSNWIPLTTLSHMLDCQLFGLDAGQHHLVNVLLHAANAVLLFLVLRQLTGSVWRSALVAALFAVHPLRAESVAWVSERKDVLSGFFFLLTVSAYVRWARKPSAAWYGLMLVLFALGLMAKSMVATLPFVLLLLDYWPLERLSNRRQFRHLVWEKIPLFALAAAACLISARLPGLVVDHPIPLKYRMINAVVSYVVYLRQAFFPRGLTPHYLLVPEGAGKAWAGLLLLTIISAGVAACRKKRPFLLTGWLWYLGMLFPVIGIIQISGDAAHADRYTYLPEIGLAMAVVWLASDWVAKRSWGRGVFAVMVLLVIGALAVSARIQTSYWRADESLWTRVLTCNSNDYVAYNGLGTAISRKGDKEKAIVLYRKALEFAPADKMTHYNIGITLYDLGEPAGAVAEYMKSLQDDPNNAEVRNNLGVALAAMGDRDGAYTQYMRALKIKPDFAEARFNLGNALVQDGELKDAIGEYEIALSITPDDERILNNLGIALSLKGENAQAIPLFRRALVIKPDFADAQSNLGAALAKVGKVDEAIAEYHKVLERKPDDAKARFGLGKALLRKQDISGALACFQKTTVLNPDPWTRWLNLGGKFLETKDFEEAIVCFRQAITADPQKFDGYERLGTAFLEKGEIKEAEHSWEMALLTDRNHPSLQNDLAWLLATAPDASLRDGATAVMLAEQADELTGKHDPLVLHTLAAAYAETGRYGDATAAAQYALALAEGENDDGLTAKLAKEIKLYEANKPVRGILE